MASDVPPLAARPFIDGAELALGSKAGLVALAAAALLTIAYQLIKDDRPQWFRAAAVRILLLWSGLLLIFLLLRWGA